MGSPTATLAVDLTWWQFRKLPTVPPSAAHQVLARVDDRTAVGVTRAGRLVRLNLAHEPESADDVIATRWAAGAPLIDWQVDR